MGGSFDWINDNLWTTDANGTAGTLGGWTSGDSAYFNGNGTSIVTMNSTTSVGVFAVASAASGAVTLNLSGSGTVNSANAYIGNASSATGTLSLSGGINLASSGSLYVGSAGGSGTLNLSGNNTVVSFTASYLGGGGTGTVNVNGGTLNTSTASGNIYIGNTITGTLNINGGTVNCPNYTWLSKAAGSSGTINLNGGRFAISKEVTKGTGGSAILNFNGGVLAVNASVSTMITALDSLNVQAGGAFIDTSNWNGVINQPLVTGVTGSPDGGLTKYGTSILSLTGNNTYTGPTYITAGTLNMVSATTILSGTSLISISSNATLNTYNVVSPGFTLTGSSPQQTLACPNTNGVATVSNGSTTRALTLNSGALLSFQAAGGPNSTNGQIKVTSDITLNNNAVTVNVTGPSLAPGSYLLMTNTGRWLGSASSTVTITGTPLASGLTATITTTAPYSGGISLNVTKGTPTFSALTASPSLTYGATSLTLSGNVNAGSAYPANGETITVTINGHPQTTTINDSTGDFSLTYNTATIPYSATPYTITYAYAGDSSLNAANNTATSLTVNKAALTVTAGSRGKTYGTPVTFAGTEFTTLGLVNGNAVSSVTLGSAGSVATATSGAYNIVPSSAVGSGLGNYAITYANGTLTVAPAPLTVSAAVARSYGATNPVLTASYSGFVGSDDASVLSGAPALTCSADANSPAGSYPITVGAGTLLAANYNLNAANGTLTVTQAVLTVSADNLSRAYGQANPVLTVSYSGLMNNDSASDTNVLSGAADVSTLANASSPMGAYDIVVTNGTLSATNYSFAFTNGTLTVVTAVLTPSLTVLDKVYDGGTNATVATSSLSGVVGTDDVGLAGGVASFADKNVGAGRTVTVTGLTLAGTTATNYVLSTNAVTTTASINVFALVVSAAGVDKVYDGTTAATVILSDNHISGDDLSTAYATAAFADQNTGSGKPVIVSGISIGGVDAGNYTFNTTASALASITALPITVTASANSKVYDGTVAAAAAPTISSGSLALGDTPTFTESYDTKDVGSAKTLTPAGLVNDGNSGNNYAVTFATGAGGISAAPLTITADSKSRIYGVANPVLTPSYSGFVNGEDATILSTLPILSTTATVSSPAGTYPISASAAVALDYNISYVDGTLTVIALPQFSSINVVGDQVILTFPTTLGQAYQIDYSSDLTLPAWSALGDPIPGTGGTVSVTNSQGSGVQGYFRLKLQP